MNSTIVVLILATLLALSAADLAKDGDKQKLGSFCNPLDGCRDASLTCIKNRCECAPGFRKSKKDDDICKEEKCEKDKDCNKLDPNRKCDNGRCLRCKAGLFLDPVVNRCVTKLGQACNQTTDCIYFSNDIDDFDTVSGSIICRSGRCVCKSNYFPNADWSECKLRRCESREECNPFGDDPHRHCSKALGACQCNMGYYEETRMSVCLPFIPIQYSLMMPFWLTMIMFTICILVYVSRRLARARTIVSQENISAPEAAPIPHALNLPPPSYDTVVKDAIAPTETRSDRQTQSPNYPSTVAVNRQV